MSDELKALLDCLNTPLRPYGWDLPDAAAVESFEVLTGEDAAELGDRSVRFFDGLDNLFSSNVYIKRLQEYFGERIPTAKLQEITTVCRELVARDLSRLERLCLSLDELLPQWSQDDVQLLTRAYSGAFRSGQSLLERSPQSEAWDELSELGQAKCLVAIAYFVLTDLETLEEPKSLD
ncbi:MAG: hypothetical protein WBB82_18110 [Limnothrix sp.]